MIRALSSGSSISSISKYNHNHNHSYGLISILSRFKISVQKTRRICYASRSQRIKRCSSIRRYSFAFGIALATSLYMQNNHDDNSFKVECKGSGAEDEELRSDFYPEIHAYQSGSLQVSEIHTIAYFVYGNPNGKPVVYLHGGPGSGSKPCKLYLSTP